MHAAPSQWNSRKQFGTTKPLQQKVPKRKQISGTKPTLSKVSSKDKDGSRRFGTILTNNGPGNMAIGKKAHKVAARRPKPTNSVATTKITESMKQPISTKQEAQQSTSFDKPGVLSATPNFVDVDRCDRYKPQCVTDYVVDIFKNFKKAEVRGCASPKYMDLQTQITPKMRGILIDWLVEVHQKFKLMPETLFLTINLIDRFLEKQVVQRQKLQLVGVTCMLLASKYEEIYFPEIRDFVYITDNAYNRRQILKMEEVVLNVLKFDLTVPTANCFVRRFIKTANYSSSKLTHMATYISERMLQEYSMLNFPPSIVAASAVSMALTFLQMPSWNTTLTHYTGYNATQLKSCISKMTEILCKSSSLKAVQKKYASSKYDRVSNDVSRLLKRSI